MNAHWKDNSVDTHGIVRVLSRLSTTMNHRKSGQMLAPFYPFKLLELLELLIQHTCTFFTGDNGMNDVEHRTNNVHLRC